MVIDSWLGIESVESVSKWFDIILIMKFFDEFKSCEGHCSSPVEWTNFVIILTSFEQFKLFSFSPFSLSVSLTHCVNFYLFLRKENAFYKTVIHKVSHKTGHVSQHINFFLFLLKYLMSHMKKCPENQIISWTYQHYSHDLF